LGGDQLSGKHSRSTSIRGSVEDSTEPQFVTIGRISKPHGVRGEVRVIPLTDLPERFEWLDYVYVGDKQPIRVKVESVRYHQDSILIKLTGYPTRDEAERLRDQLLQVPESETIPLAEGEYFLHQAIGLEARTESGTYIGRVTDILETGANNVFVITGPLGEQLIPDIPDVIREVDIEKGQLVISPIPGMFDDPEQKIQ
jgi:16S rRNA processing protein RimM